MRRVYGSALALAVMLVPGMTAQAQETSKSVANGGIMAEGWTGKVDANEEKAGKTVKDAMFMKEGAGFHATTGPATTYWNPANKATGNYTVKATFKEPSYMGLNDHPHPYGIVIAGNDMGTDNQSFLYCTAYGNGTYIMRGFNGSTPFQLGGRRPTEDAAVHKAAGKDQPVSQEIGIQVKGDQVSCLINGKAVISYPKSEVVGPGKLKSTDGVWGIRFAHNTEAHVADLKMTKP